MANTMLTISKITNRALMVLENSLKFASSVNRTYSDEFAVTGAKIGNTLNVRRPGRFLGTSGPNLNVEDFYESSVPIVLGVPASYGDAEACRGDCVADAGAGNVTSGGGGIGLAGSVVSAIAPNHNST